MVGLLDGWMVGWWDGWRVGGLDFWIVVVARTFSNSNDFLFFLLDQKETKNQA